MHLKLIRQSALRFAVVSDRRHRGEHPGGVVSIRFKVHGASRPSTMPRSSCETNACFNPLRGSRYFQTFRHSGCPGCEYCNKFQSASRFAVLPDLVMERSRNDQKFQSASRFAVLPDLKKEKRLCSKGGSFNPLRGSRCFQTNLSAHTAGISCFNPLRGSRCFQTTTVHSDQLIYSFQSASRFAVLPDPTP